MTGDSTKVRQNPPIFVIADWSLSDVQMHVGSPEGEPVWAR